MVFFHWNPESHIIVVPTLFWAGEQYGGAPPLPMRWRSFRKRLFPSYELPSRDKRNNIKFAWFEWNLYNSPHNKVVGKFHHALSPVHSEWNRKGWHISIFIIHSSRGAVCNNRLVAAQQSREHRKPPVNQTESTSVFFLHPQCIHLFFRHGACAVVFRPISLNSLVKLLLCTRPICPDRSYVARRRHREKIKGFS